MDILHCYISFTVLALPFRTYFSANTEVLYCFRFLELVELFCLCITVCIGCARASELGADDRAKADGIISGFRRRRVYPSSVLSRGAATVVVDRAVIISAIIGTATTTTSSGGGSGA